MSFKEFWTSLTEKIDDPKDPFHSLDDVKASEYEIMKRGRKDGYGWKFWLNPRRNTAAVELAIDMHHPEKNLAAFNSFYRQKDDIEAEFGDELQWPKMDGRRRRHIRYVIDADELDDPSEWNRVQQQMIDAMSRLRGTLTKRFPPVDHANL